MADERLSHEQDTGNQSILDLTTRDARETDFDVPLDEFFVNILEPLQGYLRSLYDHTGDAEYAFSVTSLALVGHALEQVEKLAGFMNAKHVKATIRHDGRSCCLPDRITGVTVAKVRGSMV